MSDWWLISDADMRTIRAALEETEEWCDKGGRKQFRDALHALDSGLHVTDAVPTDLAAATTREADPPRAANLSSRLQSVLDEVYEWQCETFPSRTPNSIAAHLLEEAKELSEAPTDGKEMADVAMLLSGLVRDTGIDLAEEVAAKLARNRQRDWSGGPNEKGYVKARATPAEQGAPDDA